MPLGPTRLTLPDWLARQVSATAYETWLISEADKLYARDQAKGVRRFTRTDYRRMLHAAIRRSAGLDYYTGEVLDWSLIATPYPKPTGRKDMMRCGGRPSVDHYAGPGHPDYKLCRADTNHAKAYLGYGSFVALCRKVVAHADRREAECASRRAGGGGPGET